MNPQEIVDSCAKRGIRLVPLRHKLIHYYGPNGSMDRETLERIELNRLAIHKYLLGRNGAKVKSVKEKLEGEIKKLSGVIADHKKHLKEKENELATLKKAKLAISKNPELEMLIGLSERFGR